MLYLSLCSLNDNKYRLDYKRIVANLRLTCSRTRICLQSELGKALKAKNKYRVLRNGTSRKSFVEAKCFIKKRSKKMVMSLD